MHRVASFKACRAKGEDIVGGIEGLESLCERITKEIDDLDWNTVGHIQTE